MPNAKNPSAKVRVSHSKAPAAAPIAPRIQTITQYVVQLNARPDPIDFRDLMFEPTLIEVPPHITLDEYRAKYRHNHVPVHEWNKKGRTFIVGVSQ